MPLRLQLSAPSPFEAEFIDANLHRQQDLPDPVSSEAKSSECWSRVIGLYELRQVSAQSDRDPIRDHRGYWKADLRHLATARFE